MEKVTVTAVAKPTQKGGELPDRTKRVGSLGTPGDPEPQVTTPEPPLGVHRLPHHPTEPFVKGRKFFIPKDDVIIFALPTDQHWKLEDWQAKDDEIHIHTGPHGEVWLTNATRLEKWRRRRDAKKRLQEAPEK